jgi:hypothetical protein
MLGIKCLLSLYIRFSINCLIFNILSALVRENPGSTSFCFQYVLSFRILLTSCPLAARRQGPPSTPEGRRRRLAEHACPA